MIVIMMMMMRTVTTTIIIIMLSNLNISKERPRLDLFACRGDVTERV